MNISNKLDKLDFTSGIRAGLINKNFETVHGWVTKERKNLGGYGIIDGFEMKANNKSFTVSVAPGHMINNDGEEIVVDSAMFSAGVPEAVKATNTVVCSTEGIAEMPVRPYSKKNPGYIEFIAGGANYPEQGELYVSDAETGDRVQILQVIENRIYVDADLWAHRKLKIESLTTDNRVDSVLLSTDGAYRYEKGIRSTSPSHVDAKDYPGWFLVGTVEWVIGTQNIQPKFYTNHRTYRKVYVNEDNDLYLNGRLYHDAQLIYFSEPDTPEENDLWYDKTSNSLLVWQLTKNGWGWMNVNDHASMNVRTCKIWTPDDMPSDNRTFRFTEKETDMYFTPGTNAIDVMVNNVLLMKDQMQEIVDVVDVNVSTGKKESGIGFKLKDPLADDGKTYVQCIVHHVVRANATSETFQKAAVFVSEDHTKYSEADNPGQVFITSAPFIVGEEQLEVYLDGKRLINDVDFQEMVSLTTAATDADRANGKAVGQSFKIVTPLTPGQIVNYRILKHVWSYDHVAKLMKEITDDTEEALNQCKKLRVDLTNSNSGSVKRDEEIAATVNAIKDAVNRVNDAFLKTDLIPINNMDSSVKGHLIDGDLIDVAMPATQMKLIADIKTTDFIQAHIISPTENRVLIKGTDYTLTQTKDGVYVNLRADLMTSTATIYVNGFKIGVK